VKQYIQYNLIKDITADHRDIVEIASGQQVANLDIDDVNSFLNGLYLFMDPEAYTWKN